jgi:hypothetical protein
VHEEHAHVGLLGQLVVGGRGRAELLYCRVAEMGRIGLGGDVMTHSAPIRSAHLRPQAVLIRQREAHTSGARREAGFDRGAYDTLTWLIEGGPGPLTGEMVGLPIPAAVIVHELAAAEAVLSTAPSRCYGYAAAVLETLMWAEMATPEPPRALVPRGPVRERAPQLP